VKAWARRGLLANPCVPKRSNILAGAKKGMAMDVYIAILIIIPTIWIAFEIWLVYRDRIQGKGNTRFDQGTRYLNFIGLVIGIIGAALLSGYSAFYFPGARSTVYFWIGIVIMPVGLALRIWAVQILGNSFRTTVETHVNQKVVNYGPYRLIRHPSYSGLLLICLGYGIAIQNWLSLACVVIIPLLALLYRIHIEEPALLASMGEEYRTYQKNTKKIIPWIY
jgi:protein-S-isoprenylcysteine O-methyltransferase Ste14